MNYSWINTPLLDGINYFSSLFGFFLAQARKLGNVLGIACIAWYCFQLMFSTIATRKAIINILTNAITFILILNVYSVGVASLKHLATDWGINAGGARTRITNRMSDLYKNLEQNLEKESARDMVSMNVYDRGGTSMNDSPFALEMDDMQEKASQKVERANQGSNIIFKERTFNALKTVLKPLPLDSEEEHGASIAKAYFLDLLLRDGRGNATGFLSPNAIFRVALLTAQIMIEVEWQSIKKGWEEDAQGKWAIDPRKYIPAANMSLMDIINLILVYICSAACIFASCFALIQYVMCILEYTIISSLAIIFVPCCLFDGTKDLFNKIVPAFLGLSIKMLVITLCIMFALDQYLTLLLGQLVNNTSFNFSIFAYVIFMVLLSWVVTQNAPQIAVTLLTGNPQLSMGEVVHAVGTAAAVGAGAAVAAGKVQAAGSSAARGGVQALGGMAESAGAAQKGYSEGGIKGAVAEVAKNTGSRMKQGVQNAAHSVLHGEKGGKSGGGGGGGNALNTKDSGIAGKMSQADKATLGSIYKDDIAKNNRSFASSETELTRDGVDAYGKPTKEPTGVYRASSVGEFMKQRFAQGGGGQSGNKKPVLAPVE